MAGRPNSLGPVDRGVLIQGAVLTPLSLVTIIFAANQWWAVAVVSAVAVIIAAVWMRTAIVRQRADEAIEASKRFDESATSEAEPHED